MSNDKKSSFEDALDKFWTIDDIVPKQKKNIVKIQLKNEVVNINLSFEKEKSFEKCEEKTYYIPPYKPKKPKTPEFEYDVQNSLIHHVAVFNTHDTSGTEYDRFCEDASRYCDIHGYPCEKVEFFSNSPQYTQLNKKQLNYYLYWRDCVRKGDFIDTDYSYVVLYIFELVHLGKLINIKKSVQTIFDVWERYRKKFAFLDKLCIEVLCDFALLNQINLLEILGPESLSKMIPNAFLKEFYFCTDIDKCNESVKYLLENCSNYNFYKSKFAVGENLPLYETHISGALKYTIKKLSVNGFLSEAKLEDNTITRLSYMGFYCSPVHRKKIVVSLSSFSNSHELRFMITDIVKYSENRIRAAIGVKSRLTVISLSVQTKKFIDEYFNQAIPENLTKPKKTVEEVFDENYDVAIGEISISEALNIEKKSWETANTLVEAFDEEENTEILMQKAVEITDTIEYENETTKNQCVNPYEKYHEFLDYVVDKNYNSQREYAKRMGKLLDSVADEINEIAIEQTGDVLLYSEDNGYLIINDYLEEFLNVFRG